MKQIRPKIIFVVPSFRAVSPVRGALALARGLLQEYSIFFVSIDSRDDFEDTIENELKDLKINYIYLNENHIWGIQKGATKLAEFCKTHNVKVIFSYLLRADLITSITKCDAKKISSVRNFISDEYSISYGRLLGVIFTWFHIRAQRRFDALVCISSGLRDYYLSLGFQYSNTHLIHNFLDEPKLKNAVESRDSDNKELYTFISVSSLTKRKNLQELLHGFLKLKGMGVSFSAAIVGDGSERDALESLTNELGLDDYVSFLGHIDNPIELMKRSKIFVMTSKAEGVSRSLLEAIYLGKFCVVKNILGVSELVKEGIGITYGNQDKLGLILNSAIISTLKNKQLISLPLEFTYEHAVEKHKELLKGLLN